PAHLLHFGLQPAFDRGEHELADVPAHDGDLAHDGARDELVLVRGGEKQGLDVGQQIAVHAGHLELVFEVRYGAQTTHDDARVLRADEILEQPAEAFDFHIGIVAQNFLGYVDAFTDAEKRLLGMAVRYTDHHFVEQGGGPAYEVFMAARQRVERAGVHGNNHRALLRVLRGGGSVRSYIFSAAARQSGTHRNPNYLPEFAMQQTLPKSSS